MPVEGPLSAGGGESLTGVGTVAWSNPGFIISSNDSRATSTLTLTDPTSNYIKATSFAFALLGAAIVDGIQVDIERSQSSIIGQNISDNTMKLMKAGVIGGTEKAQVASWTTADTVITYGSPTDLWGQTWTPADIRANGFGIVLSATKAGITSQDAQIDHVKITINYTLTNSVPTASSDFEPDNFMMMGIG